MEQVQTLFTISFNFYRCPYPDVVIAEVTSDSEERKHNIFAKFDKYTVINYQNAAQLYVWKQYHKS